MDLLFQNKSFGHTSHTHHTTQHTVWRAEFFNADGWFRYRQGSEHHQIDRSIDLGERMNMGCCGDQRQAGRQGKSISTQHKTQNNHNHTTQTGKVVLAFLS